MIALKREKLMPVSWTQCFLNETALIVVSDWVCVFIYRVVIDWLIRTVHLITLEVFFLGFLVMSTYLELVLPCSGSGLGWPHLLHYIQYYQLGNVTLQSRRCPSPDCFSPIYKDTLTLALWKGRAMFGRVPLSGAQRWCIKLTPVYLSAGSYDLAGMFQKPVCLKVLQISHSWLDHGCQTNSRIVNLYFAH